MDLLEMRALARRVFDAGVAAADPYSGVAAALERAPVGDGTPVVAVGKAAVRMAEAALAAFKAGPTIIVTNPENARDVPGAELFAASHPVPNQVGIEAAKAVETLLADASSEVLALISGGG
ncbi:MAG: DUF4147 domain-containing protein, partial [Pseudomonadota bacterium]